MIRRMKQIIFIAILSIIAILAYSNVSKAAYSVGDTVSLNYYSYVNSNDLFCVEHGQRLRSNYVTYKVISEVSIVGKESTDQTGKTITSWHNAKLSYILSSTNSGSSKQTSPVQNAIWNYMYTWMNQVGKNHAGLYAGFVSDTKGNSDYSKTLEQEATEYANDVENLTEFTDNTKKSSISVTSDGSNIKIGPFNWTFSGTLSSVVVKDQDGKAISGVTFSLYSGTSSSTVSVSGIKSGKNFYISIPISSGVTSISSISASGSVNLKSVTIWFLESQSGAKYQNLISRETGESPYEYEDEFEYNIDLLGNLKVIKVNEDNEEIKLQGVGFKIQNKQTGLYVHQDSSGNITYVSESQATEFITDANGEITIENLIVGTYVAYETQNPNYGYELITDGVELTVVVNKTTSYTIGNKQIYVKLSGYVWVDKASGKQSVRNDLYMDDEYDDGDELLEGVIVRLKDRTTGATIDTATTQEITLGDNIIRYYQFVDVLIEDLDNYYIEFEYDGLTYTNVTPHIDVDNGSKAAENADERDEFNKSFSSIEGESQTTGVALDENDNVAHNLTYEKDTENHTSTLIHDDGQFPITANTDETGYSIIDNFEYGMEEIPYINLGLYKREQPDLAVVKDIQNVRLAINGYQHIYEYASRFDNEGDYVDGFNVGVKFASEYIESSYTRAIYEADYTYVNEEDSSRELQVYITYRIAIRNESSNLTSRVNELIDYYDSRYSIVGVGTGIDEEGILTGSIEYTEQGSYNSEYNTAIIHTNLSIEAGYTTSIYVQFQLSREAVVDILNENEMLDNVTEVYSYSTFDSSGNVYAGVDVDSNPGNVVPGDSTTYEDDSDKSPALLLEVADARALTGTVFLDETSDELLTGQVREGDGLYDEENEIGISGVDVTLTEISGTGLTYTAVTDSDGNFEITDYIPGDYTLTYTWGDETYTVQNYKATIYNYERYQDNYVNGNTTWYKGEDMNNPDTRYSDAIDDYETRLAIDEELTEITSSSADPTITKMDSTTPEMSFGVEYSATTSSGEDKLTYEVYNLDFGIVERARQDVSLEKTISSVKLTLANGQVLVDLVITEDGELEGQTSNVIYIPPSENSSPTNGLLRIELDTELMQGATLEVTYTITVSNNSELDYIDENYYTFGTTAEGLYDTSTVVTITPTGIVDYLDTDWSFDSTTNTDWETVEKDDSRLDLAESVQESEGIDNVTILYTEALATPLEPAESNSVDLTVSKLLTTTGDIELNNEAEIVKVDKPGGSKITTSTPGNYVPTTYTNVEPDDSPAPTVIVTPNTGDNQNYIIPVVVTISAFAIIGVGIVIIKKKVLKK